MVSGGVVTGGLTSLLLHQLSGLGEDIEGDERIVVTRNDQNFHRNCCLALLLSLRQEGLRQVEIPVVVERSIPVISSREREFVRFLRQPDPLDIHMYVTTFN